MPRKLRPDMWIFGAVVLLLSAGVVMVYSASAIVAADRFHDPYLFLKKQLVWALLGAGCLLVALRIDYRRLERLGWPVLLAAGVLLVLVLVPPLAQPINGTRRWLRLGPVSFQPAELAKLALVIYLAGYLAQKRAEIEDFRRGLLQPLAIAVALAVLILAQPDLGNCLTLVAVTFALLYLAGSPVRYLGFIIGAALPFLALRSGSRPIGCDASRRSSTRGAIRAAADFRSFSRGWRWAAAASWAAASASRSRSSSTCRRRTRTSSSPSSVRSSGSSAPWRSSRSSPSSCGGACAWGCAPPIPSAPTWRSASPCSSQPRRSSISAS